MSWRHSSDTLKMHARWCVRGSSLPRLPTTKGTNTGVYTQKYIQQGENPLETNNLSNK